MLLASLAWADSPYSAWPNGPSADEGYFPIGVWLQNPSNASAYRQIGVNLYIGLWQGPTQAQLDGLRAAGMRTICAQNSVGLRHQDDPVIAGWLQGDEPDNIPVTHRDEVIRTYERMRTNDPSRPVFLNLGQGVVNPFFNGRGIAYWMYPIYTEGADILSFDVYPVSGVGSQRVLQYVADGVDSLRFWTQGEKPVWNIIETTRINSTRRATPRQVHSMVWMSIIHGSTGIVYFAHEWNPAFREARLLEDDEMRVAVAAINEQIHELAPVLNSPTVDSVVEVVTSVADVPVDVMVKDHGGYRYLFAASMRDGATTATFRIAEQTVQLEALGESRTITATDGAFEDSFADYEIHQYRWSLSPQTVVTETAVAPGTFRLAQNHPNPFNGSTTIEFELSAAPGQLTIYDLAGQRVTTLERDGPGVFRWSWDGRADSGVPVASGVYLVRLTSGTEVRTLRLLLLR